MSCCSRLLVFIISLCWPCSQLSFRQKKKSFIWELRYLYMRDTTMWMICIECRKLQSMLLRGWIRDSSPVEKRLEAPRSDEKNEKCFQRGFQWLNSPPADWGLWPVSSCCFLRSITTRPIRTRAASWLFTAWLLTQKDRLLRIWKTDGKYSLSTSTRETN